MPRYKLLLYVYESGNEVVFWATKAIEVNRPLLEFAACPD